MLFTFNHFVFMLLQGLSYFFQNSAFNRETFISLFFQKQGSKTKTFCDFTHRMI